MRKLANLFCPLLMLVAVALIATSPVFADTGPPVNDLLITEQENGQLDVAVTTNENGEDAWGHHTAMARINVETTNDAMLSVYIDNDVGDLSAALFEDGDGTSDFYSGAITELAMPGIVPALTNITGATINPATSTYSGGNNGAIMALLKPTASQNAAGSTYNDEVSTNKATSAATIGTRGYSTGAGDIEAAGDNVAGSMTGSIFIDAEDVDPGPGFMDLNYTPETVSRL